MNQITATTMETVAATSTPENAGLSVAAFLLCVIAYFIPTIIAFFRKTESKWGITALNLFLGWTGLGWIGALIWSLVGKRK